MECNKDEALRSKDIAVRKFTERDFTGAKKFALKAQTLYPGLEGISQMLSTLEVYISADNKVNGEMDMYGILGVSPLADDETIKKHYRKLVLMLHPDKNKSIGADGAFQLVSEAFNFLSDRAKRSAYNRRRNIRTVQQKVPPQPGVSAGPTCFRQFRQRVSTQGGVSAAPPSADGAVDQKFPTQGKVYGASRTVEKTSTTPGSSASQKRVPPQSGSSVVPPGVNGCHKHFSSTSSNERSQKNSRQKPSPTTQGVFSNGNTFWTVCTRCKMQYEYMRLYLNQTLKCPHCQVGFMAVEIPPPSNLSSFHPQQQHQKSSYRSGSGFNYSFGVTGVRWSPHFGTTAYSNITSSMSSATQATNVIHVLNKAKRGYEEEQTAARCEKTSGSDSVFTGEVPSKKRREGDISFGGTFPIQTGTGNGEIGMEFAPGQSENSEIGKDFFRGINSKFNVYQELSLLELRKILTEKALAEIHEKLQEWKTLSEARTTARNKEKSKQKMRQKSKLAKNNVIQELENCEEFSHSQEAASAGNTEQTVVEMVDMTVADSDFHTFDLDRSESSFQENQVWATYGNDDGMPHFYAMIHEVISLNPFNLRISWLNSKSNSEFGPLDWVDRGFNKTCGDFRVGKHETNKLLNSFSHKVKWVKGPRGVVQIYPQRGDIWALYRNWSPDWTEDTPDEIRHVYDMVEVLDDYNTDQGVFVAPLTKATGFRTVFFKQADSKVMQIPKEEMFRFSHQVPSHVLTGEEKLNSPKGCVELDPAATPSELLQVIAPDNQEHVTDTGSNH